MPHQLGSAGGGFATLVQHATVLGLETTTLGKLAGLDDRDATKHLADDDLDVLVVDRDALLAVDALDLVGATTTTTGLIVTAELDDGTYQSASRSPTGRCKTSPSPAMTGTANGTTSCTPHVTRPKRTNLIQYDA